MTAYTHVAFAATTAIVFNYLYFRSIFIISLASLLPDLDTKHSMITRLLYPVWKILDLLGVRHRTITHSFLLYFLLSVIAIKVDLNTLYLVSIGCITHVFLDCLNKSGVPLFLPVTDKICVLTSRRYRIRSGAKEEIYFIISFVFIAYFFYNININGGMRAYLLKYLNNYQFTYNQYLATAERVSYLDARVRHKGSQSIEEKEYLIVCATDNSRELYLWDKENRKIYSTTKDLTVLKGNLKPTKEVWGHIYLNSPRRLLRGSQEVFQRTKSKVLKKKSGDYIVKDIFYLGEIELE